MQLDLSDPEQRWILQEIVHLSVKEPGQNCGEVMLDFQVPPWGSDGLPATWLSDVPRSGVLQVYYNREARIIRKIREQGAWDHDKSVRRVWVEPGGWHWGKLHAALVCRCVLRGLAQATDVSGVLSLS